LAHSLICQSKLTKMFRKVSELLINVFSTESLITHELLRYVIRLSRVKGHILSLVIYFLEA